MREFKTDIQLETGVGQVTASSLICANDLAADNIYLTTFNFKPRLPKGMSVQNCIAILLTIDTSVQIRNLKFGLSIASKVPGSSCTGEGLDAQEWSDQGKLVVIGTENDEALMQRIPTLAPKNIVIVDFTSQSMVLEFRNLPLIGKQSFHFIVAENTDPELMDASAWFAVDQNHDYLLEHNSKDSSAS